MCHHQDSMLHMGQFLLLQDEAACEGSKPRQRCTASAALHGRKMPLADLIIVCI